MIFRPYILGSGRAGRAIKESLLILNASMGYHIEAPVIIARGAPVKPLTKEENAILFISNPSGLHAQAIFEAEKSGFKAIAAEKPVCTNLRDALALKDAKIKGAVFHGYRQMWGVQEIKKMILAHEVGEIISIEGRYWQSSAAERALLGGMSSSWKNDPALNGPSDTLLDIGTHWIDACAFLAGEKPQKVSGKLSYKNAETSHRDTHVLVDLEFSNGHGRGSISKTVHGATNQFEMVVLGTKKSLRWEFLRPDEIQVGEGKSVKTITRQSLDIGSGYSPFHALGWMEGYIGIIRELLSDLEGKPFQKYPTVQESAELIAQILSSDLIKKQ